MHIARSPLLQGILTFLPSQNKLGYFLIFLAMQIFFFVPLYAEKSSAKNTQTQANINASENASVQSEFPDNSDSANDAVSHIDNNKTPPSDEISHFNDEQTVLNKITTYIDTPIVEQRETYTKEQIDSLHAADLPTLLQAAGIQILSYGAYGLEAKPSIRGFTDETIRVVVDGVCVNNAQYGTFDFTSINVENIEHLEICRGGFTETVAAEGAVGGTIYITTKKQTLGHNFSTDTKLKSYLNKNTPLDTFSQQLGYNGQFSENSFFKANIKGTFAQNKYPYENYLKKTTIQENSKVLDAHSEINFSHYFQNANNFVIKNSTYIANKNIPGSQTSKITGEQKDYNNNFSFNLQFPELKNALKLDNNFSWISNTRFYDEPQTQNPESKHYINTFVLSSTADFYSQKKIKESAGISLNLTHLNSTNDGQHFLPECTISQTTKFLINKTFSISVPFAIKFTDTNFAVIPKLGAKAQTKYVDIILAAYRMIQFPNADDLYWQDTNYAAGNPNLSPEKGWGAEFTINAHNIIIPFSFCVFSNYYAQKIQWATNSNNKWTPQNIASAFYLGFNISTHINFLKYFSIKANAEYLYTRLLNKENQQTYGNKIMWTPDWIGSIIFSANIKNISATFESQYTGHRYTDNLNITQIDPCFLLNASLELKSRFAIPYIRFQNILDAPTEFVPNYPLPGFSVELGTKFKF